MLTYQLNEFWDKFFIKYIESVCTFKKIDVNCAELEDYIVEKDYLDPNERNVYGEHTANVIDMLCYFQEIILTGVESKKHNGKWPYVNLEQFKNLYLKLDPQGTYVDFFDKNKYPEFKTNVAKTCEETENVEELFQLCEDLAYVYVDFHIIKPLGEFNFEYAWLVLQAPFIFKDFGILLFHDDYDASHLINFTLLLVEKCQATDKKEWLRLPEFGRICRGFETMSESWLLKQAVSG
ncbi:hypothetical protein [Spiroplasma clarkii]|uniref:Uncharacterized protein n=1 Tax=Spiroplasma clarkii TaxID=2139 RepID=A0A2K8KG94_9MOLU|nr:hypothetical protein [Spiroplasma clarkii]ATX70698.1 hypothetical protein SCLAR_v1c03680 [Spiroplasma clarkii]